MHSIGERKLNVFENLNDQQALGVEIIEGPVLLLAGAGSGKTRVLTHRIANMIENNISPYNILAITFTNKAAKEMRERVMNIHPDGDKVWVSTFHSTCAKLLRSIIDLIGYDKNFTIYDTDDSKRLLKECLKELNISEKEYPVNTLINKISSAKDLLQNPKEFKRISVGNYSEEKVGDIYELYQDKLFNSNALDFNDLIFKTIEIFKTHIDVLDRYEDKFKYIMVDEYQDTNFAQYTLIKLLAKKHQNLCVVGDDDQSIYGWRGADINNILDFEKDFPQTTVIKLEENYRSTKNILNVANTVIKNNNTRKAKQLWTSNETGEKINFARLSTDFEEAIYVGNKIKEMTNNGKSYKDIAILYRTNSQSRQFEDYFVKANIPYRLLGGVRFYERKEVKDILAYLKLLNNNFDELAFKRIINVPKKGIGPATIDKIIDYSISLDLTLFEALKDADNISLGSKSEAIKDFSNTLIYLMNFAKEHLVEDLIEEIIYRFKYDEYLLLEGKNEAEKRMENINELIAKAKEFSITSDDKSLSTFLEDVSLVADIDGYDENDDTVVLMTLHSSKGLEFNNVFIVGFEDGLFPSYRSIESDDPTQLEEERRLLYVGITRGKKELYLTSAKQRMSFDRVARNPVSRFYEELPNDLINDLFEDKKPATPQTLSEKTYRDNVNSVKEYMLTNNMPIKNKTLEFEVGDMVRQAKYGIGKVIDIVPAGADYEVTIDFKKHGEKKLMAFLLKLKKI